MARLFVRSLMQQGNGQLSGIVEVDETYIGGRNIRSKTYENKTAVIGIVERQKRAGQVRAITTKQADATIASAPEP